jgi:hypothetical protein
MSSSSSPHPLFYSTVFYTAVIVLAPFIAIYCSRTKSVKGALTLGNVLTVVAAALMTTVTLQSGKLVILYASVNNKS